MIFEKEIKILNINYPVLIHHIESAGAIKSGEYLIYDRYYDTHEHNLRQKNVRIRLRQQNNEIMITKKVKHISKNSKTMTEQDIIIDSIKQGQQILEDLWLQAYKYKEKQRISYQADDVHFDIDFYDAIPTLLEIEWPTEEKIDQRVTRLWLQYHTQVTRWSNKLFEHYNQSKKLFL